MNTLVDERVILDHLDRAGLVVHARRAAAEGGLSAALAALQADFGLGEEAAAERLADTFGLTAASLATLSTYPLALSLAPFGDFVRRQALILENNDGYLVAAVDPLDGQLRDWLESLVPLGKPIAWQLATPGSIKAFLAREESRVRTLDSSLGGGGSGDGDRHRCRRPLATANFGGWQRRRAAGPFNAA